MTLQGKVVMFHAARFFGFIEESDGQERFFHMSLSPGFVPELGAIVEYELAPPIRLGKRDQAVNVRGVKS